MMSEKDKYCYDKYADDVISGKIVVSSYMRKLVERYLRLRERSDIYFDRTDVDFCIDLASRMEHFLGKSAGQKFEFLPWQQFVCAVMLGLKYRKSGLRVCRDVYLQCARKTGKSSFIAAIAIYFLIADGEASPLVSLMATSRDQARLIFNMITEYGMSIDPDGKIMNYFRNYIKTKFNKGECKVYSSDVARLNGLNISCAIIDEAAALTDNRLYQIAKTSMAMRQQPMIIQITTPQGLKSPCYDTFLLSKDILNGVKTDDSFWPFIFSLDEDDEWDDRNVWIKSNPSLGVTTTVDYIESQVQAAKNDSSKMIDTKTLTIGIWVQNAVEQWIADDKIAGCMKNRINLEDFRGCSGCLGIDLSTVNDFSALSLCIEKDEKYVFFNWTFIPYECFKNHSNNELYNRFKENGEMIVTPGSTQDYEYIKNVIYDISQILHIEEIRYDKYNATHFINELEGMGYVCSAYSQSISSFNEPTKMMERSINNGDVIIDRSTCVLWQFRNVVMKMDYNNNVKPTKLTGSQKIDNIISMIEALSFYVENLNYGDNSIVSVRL